MRKSKLFGEKELEMLEKRIEGNKKDKHGLWINYVKPKVEEILNTWIPRKKELNKAVKARRRNKNE